MASQRPSLPRFTVEPGGSIRRKALGITAVWFVGISRNIVVVLGALGIAYAFRNGTNQITHVCNSHAYMIIAYYMMHALQEME